MVSSSTSRSLTNSSTALSTNTPYTWQSEAAASLWSLTVVRTLGLERLRPGGTGKAWKPTVCISIDDGGSSSKATKVANNTRPATLSENADVFETTLGTDGQNPNLKVPFYLPYTSAARLSIEIFHSPPSKKKGRSSRRTRVASAQVSASAGSCNQLSLGALWARQKGAAGNEDEDAEYGVVPKTKEKDLVHVRLLPHAPQKRTSNGSASARGKASASQTNADLPIIVLRLVPPARSRTPPAALDVDTNPLIPEIQSTVGSPTLSPTTTSSDHPLRETESSVSTAVDSTEQKSSSELRQRFKSGERPRKKRRVTGFCVDSDQDVVSCSASDYSSGSDEDGETDRPPWSDSPDTTTTGFTPDDDTSDYSEETKEKPTPGYLVQFIAFSFSSSSILPTYTPRPTFNPTEYITPLSDQDQKADSKWSRAVTRVHCALETVLSSFTLYEPLRRADAMDGDEGDGSKRDAFNAVFLKLQVEWTYMGGLLVALAAVDTALFAISPADDPLFVIDEISRMAVATSCISAGLGITCDAWFFLRYGWADLDTFIYRARDVFSTYFFFALAARLPALLLAFSALSLLTFLGRVAFAAWPTGAMVLCVVVGIVMTLQFLVYGVVHGVKGVGRAGRACTRMIVRRRPNGPVGGGGGGLPHQAPGQNGQAPVGGEPPVVSLRSIPPMARR